MLEENKESNRAMCFEDMVGMFSCGAVASWKGQALDKTPEI
jgi:hypothetical protein